jgi:ATP-binding cassette, subfamily C (CFTR/MRP), member 1
MGTYGSIDERATESSSDVNGDKLEDETSPLINEISGSTKIEDRSLWSHLVFKWFTPVLDLGNEKKRLDQSDLNLVPLPTDCSTEACNDQFLVCWKREVKNNPSDPSLIKAIFNAFGRDYINAGLLKLFHDMCLFVGPQILRGMIKYLRREPGSAGSSVWNGIALTVAVTCSQVFMSLCLRHYFFKCYTTGLRIRSSIIVAVYQKALLLSVIERQGRSQGEITNLMSIDAQRLQGRIFLGFWRCFMDKVDDILMLMFLYSSHQT